MRVIAPVPESKFTCVPNELITCDLEPAQKIAWIQLASLCRNGKSPDFARKVAGIAKELGISEQALRKMANKLASLGAVEKEDGDLVLIVPTAEDIEKEEDKSISNEIQEQAKRKPSGVSQNEAWELIKEAWNREKPDPFFRLDGKVNLPAFIAFESQAKRLGIERPDYGKFTAQVLRGASNDDWWSQREMKISGIFGYSAKIQDTKFTNVEKLYKLGGKLPDTKFSLRDDTAVLRWFNEKDPDHGWASVEHIKMEEDDETWAHDKLHSSGTVIYLYHHPETDRIHYWTGRGTRKFRYTPDATL